MIEEDFDEDCRKLASSLHKKFYPLDLAGDEGHKTTCGSLMRIATPEQVCAARVLAWVRQFKKSIPWCSQTSCYPAPKGHKTKKGIWMPEPSEACDASVNPFTPGYTKEGEFKPGRQPYAWWAHCKTFDHCLFIVVKRPRFFTTLIPDKQFLCLAVASMMKDKVVPMMIEHKGLLYESFFKSWCCGTVPSEPIEEVNSSITAATVGKEECV